MALIDVLGDFVQQITYAQLPAEVIHHAKLRVLDYLAVSLSGFKNGLHKPFLKLWKGCSGEFLASVVGEGSRTPWNHAAFINASMCPADMTDGSRFAALHPSSIVIPSALATFEANYSKVKPDGRTLLLAIALGYEVMIRLGRVMNPSAVKRGFHLTPIVGPLASSTAAGKILNLSSLQLGNSLSIATTLGSGLLYAFQAPESFIGIQIARACEGGILSAQLGRDGIQGNRRILEEAFIPAHSDQYNINFITQDLGKEFMINKGYIKIHAGCRHIHAPIDATLMIVQQNNISWRDIEQIKMKTYSVARELEIEHPQTGDDAKFNMPFGIAVALIRGNAF